MIQIFEIINLETYGLYQPLSYVEGFANYAGWLGKVINNYDYLI